MQPDEPHNEQQGFFDRFFSGDRVLWVIIAILSIASLLVIYSSTASMAYRKAGGDTAHYFLQQLKFIVLGFAAMIAVHRIDYQRYARPRFLSFVFVTALLFMLLTFFVGVNLNSASRWIRIPLIGVTFQPSDFLRIALIAIRACSCCKSSSSPCALTCSVLLIISPIPSRLTHVCDRPILKAYITDTAQTIVTNTSATSRHNSRTRTRPT